MATKKIELSIRSASGTGVNTLHFGDIPVDKVFFGNDGVDSIYLGDNLVYGK